MNHGVFAEQQWCQTEVCQVTAINSNKKTVYDAAPRVSKIPCRQKMSKVRHGCTVLDTPDFYLSRYGCEGCTAHFVISNGNTDRR